VREQLYVDPSDRDVELVEADRCAAAGIDQKFLVATLDERAPRPSTQEAVGWDSYCRNPALRRPSRWSSCIQS